MVRGPSTVRGRCVADMLWRVKRICCMYHCVSFVFLNVTSTDRTALGWSPECVDQRVSTVVIGSFSLKFVTHTHKHTASILSNADLCILLAKRYRDGTISLSAKQGRLLQPHRAIKGIAGEIYHFLKQKLKPTSQKFLQLNINGHNVTSASYFKYFLPVGQAVWNTSTALLRLE